jgi:hypothetical protein
MGLFHYQPLCVVMLSGVLLRQLQGMLCPFCILHANQVFAQHRFCMVICQMITSDGQQPGVTGNNVPGNKCPWNNILCCNDLNLRSLVSIAMHLNRSTNNTVNRRLFSRGTSMASLKTSVNHRT